MTPALLLEAKRQEQTLRVLCSGHSTWTLQDVIRYLERCIEGRKP